MTKPWRVESDFMSAWASPELAQCMTPTKVVDYCDSEEDALRMAEWMRERLGYSNIRVVKA